MKFKRLCLLPADRCGELYIEFLSFETIAMGTDRTGYLPLRVLYTDNTLFTLDILQIGSQFIACSREPRHEQ